MSQHTCCAYFKENTCIESYVAHVKRSLIVWNRLKHYYMTAIKRILGVDVDPIEIALMFHDSGKLVEAYRRSRRMFRHEIIGTYVVYSILESLGFDEKTRAIVSLAVLLHHEPIIFSAYVSSLGERYLTISIVRKVVDESDLTIYCSSYLATVLKEPMCYITSFNDTQKEIMVKVGKEVLLNLNTQKNDILKVMKNIIIKASIGDTIELQKIRASVAGILHPLVVSDSIAAYIGRSLCSHSEAQDEGTWVVKRALAQAELLDKETLMNTLCKEG